MKANIIEAIEPVNLPNYEKKLERLEIRNMILFVCGRLVSLLGTFMFSFAIGLYILDITGSGMSFALSLVLAALPRVITSPLAGVLADRLSRKHLIVMSDLLSGIVVIALYFSNFGLVKIYLTICILAIFNTVFDVTMEASKPNIVSKDKLFKVNSYGQIVNSLSSITGPILGGVFIAFIDIKLFVLINGLSFILSAISETFISFKFSIISDDNNRSEVKNTQKDRGIREGFIFVFINKAVKNIVIMSICINFVFYLGVNIPVPYLLNNVLLADKSIIGIVQAGFPLGFIIGALLISAKPPKQIYKPLMRAYYGCGLLIIIMPIPYLLSPSISLLGYGVYLAILFFGNGLLIAFIDVPILTLAQKMIPEGIRGRVFSVILMMSRLIMPIAMLISGYLVGVVNSGYVMLLSGIILFGIAVIFGRKAEIKEIDNY